MRKYGLPEARKRFARIIFIIFGLLVAVILRLTWVQIINHDHYVELAKDQITVNHKNPLPRGRIVDRNGDELAVSIVTGSLYVNPKAMQDPENVKDPNKRDVRRLSADLLAPILKRNADELYKVFNSGESFVYLKRLMEPEDVARIKELIKTHKLQGIHFEEESKRYYTKKRVAAQVLGFVGTDDKGLSGIELELDSILRGAESRYSTNEILPTESSASRSSKNSLSTVYLTLDSKMQYVLEDAMDDAIERTKAAGAAAIIMDPYTGEILGMASRPTFDPNEFEKFSAESWNNKAVSMNYEPGSVFKPLVGCMGLTEGVISPNTLIQDNGSIKIADRVIHNWDGEGMGMIPFSTVIKFSVNTGMVQLGMELGAKRLIHYAKQYGFGSPTGVDLPGEEQGLLYNPEDMYKPDIATMAIGQGIAVTPLQELRAICAIANGGELVKPYIVKKIIAPNGEVIRENGKQVVRTVLTPQVAAQMREMMEGVVRDGGGKTAAIKGYRIAGKTGTAEKLAEGGGYAAGKYIASFVGFVPADKPLYAMLVMLDTPKGAFYGSQVSAPIFRDTLQQILVAKGIQPDDSVGLPSFDGLQALKKVEKGVKPFPPAQVGANGLIKLPDFTGHDMRHTAEFIEQGGLRLKPYGSGKAFGQKPPAEAEVAPGTTVEVWFK